MSHVRGRVNVSHIAKRLLTWEVYKWWTPLLSQYIFWEWIRPMNFYMVLERVPWTMLDISLPLLNMCLAKSCHTWGGVLKCSTSLRNYWPEKFISHGHHSSLKTSFESKLGPHTFAGLRSSQIICLNLREFEQMIVRDYL
jgi:hypothetical protein